MSVRFLATCFITPRLGPTRRVQKYKRTLRLTRRAVAEFIYHYHGELNHQGLGNAFVFLDTTSSGAPAGRNGWSGGEVCSGAPIAEPVPRRLVSANLENASRIRAFGSVCVFGHDVREATDPVLRKKSIRR